MTSHEFESMKQVCKAVNDIPGFKASLRFIGDFKTQQSILVITAPLHRKKLYMTMQAHTAAQ